MLLTPYEYDQLPDDVKAQLAGIVRHPRNDKHTASYGRRRGRYLNGEIDADPQAQQVVGYGTGSPLAPHTNPDAQ